MLKSAYELALEKSGGLSGTAVTEEQKAQLAELDLKFRAKVAELEIRTGETMRQALASGDPSSVEALSAELAEEKARLDRDLEAAKAKVRGGGR